MQESTPSTRTMSGIIRVSLKGTGFVRQEDPKLEAIEIDRRDLNTALHGDTVTIELRGTNRYGKPSGVVTSVTKRSKRGFAGELKFGGGEWFVKASDPKMYTTIIIPERELHGAQKGDKVFAKITKWTDGTKLPLGAVERVLGRAGEHNAEMEGIILERGFDSSFPADIERDAEALRATGITADEAAKRRDMRGTLTMTIDPADAKDFDDALSFKRLDNGHFEIGVHIADVSHYVRPKTRLDEEARERATSVYLVDRTIPMLPEALSNDMCSLNPNVDRLAFSAIFEMDIKGQVYARWFGKTIINSDKRFAYEEAQRVLDDGAGPYFEELTIMNTIAKALTAERLRAGAITMETEEIKFKLDETGKPISVYIKERGDTNKLIEEFMLLANKEVAIYGSHGADAKERPFIYRIHDTPAEDKIIALKEYLKLLGYSLNERRGTIPPEEFNRLFAELEGTNEKASVQSVVIRSMQKAIYSTKNIGHYGLAFPFYTHFTSPIRRYPDIMAHRMLETYLNGGHISAEMAASFQKTAEHSTEREIEAADAERSSIKYKQIEYMAERVGQEFDGIVTGLSEWGMYIAEKTTRAEGFVRLKDIPGKQFIYDPKAYLVRDAANDTNIRIGDEVRIRMEKADAEKQTLDYSLVMA